MLKTVAHYLTAVHTLFLQLRGPTVELIPEEV